VTSVINHKWVAEVPPILFVLKLVRQLDRLEKICYQIFETALFVRNIITSGVTAVRDVAMAHHMQSGVGGVLLDRSPGLYGSWWVLTSSSNCFKS